LACPIFKPTAKSDTWDGDGDRTIGGANNLILSGNTALE
jgi:hypothetical protein